MKRGEVREERHAAKAECPFLKRVQMKRFESPQLDDGLSEKSIIDDQAVVMVV